MNLFNIPEPNLEPPADKRRVVATCKICYEPILEGDDAYDIPDFGFCCTRCIKDARVNEVEVGD